MTQRARETLPKSYMDILKNMFEAIQGLIEEVMTSLSQDDNESLESAAHHMKTNGATLGAMELSALAQKTENAAKVGDVREIPDFVLEIEAKYLRVTPAINKLLS